MATVLGVLLLCSCANPLNEATYRRYYEAGLEAERQGDRPLAHENYRRALINAEIGNLGDRYEAGASYQLARVSGFLCKLNAAEDLFLRSIAHEERASPNSGLLSRKLLEFGRFLSDQERYANALPYFERGLTIVEGLDVEQQDPIGLSGVLDEYAAALREAGQLDLAEQREARARALRVAHPDVAAGFTAEHYPQECSAARN